MSSALPKARIIASDGRHLKDCIQSELYLHGPTCSLNHIDVSRVTDMTGMFSNSPFNGDISEWDMSNVQRTNSMFFACPFNGDISKWNTPNLSIAIGMFHMALFNGDLSSWTTASLRNASSMFRSGAFEGDISKWDVSSLENCERMFLGSKCKSDLSAWTLPKTCKYLWMTNEKFEGILPQLSGSGTPSMRYGRMFGEHSALRTYLERQPFSHVHATLLMALKTKPEWATPAMFKQAKEVQSMGAAVGLKSKDVHAQIMASFAPSKTMESFSVDDLIPV